MELTITKQEARQRMKAKATSIIGVPLMAGGIFMFLSSITFFLHKNPDLKFEWEQYSLMIGWGYTLFAAKESLIKGMTGLLLPKKK